MQQDYSQTSFKGKWVHYLVGLYLLFCERFGVVILCARTRGISITLEISDKKESYAKKCRKTIATLTGSSKSPGETFLAITAISILV